MLHNVSIPTFIHSLDIVQQQWPKSKPSRVSLSGNLRRGHQVQLFVCFSSKTLNLHNFVKS